MSRLKQTRFVAEYLVDLNATQAAIRAGYSRKTANEQGARLLANASVRAAVAAGTKRQLENAEVTAEQVLREVTCLAYSRATDLFDAEDRLRPLSEWPPELAAAVRTVQTREDADGVRVVSVSLWDKGRALDLLCRYLGLLKDSVHLQGPIEIQWKDSIAERLIEGRKRVAEYASRQEPDDRS